MSSTFSGKTNKNVKSGLELIWCDLGLTLNEISKILYLMPPSLKEELNKFNRILIGPFSECSKMAIPTWFRFFYIVNHKLYSSEEEKKQREREELMQAWKHLWKSIKHAINHICLEMI